VALVQLQEVVGLQHLVAELRVGDTGAHAALDRLPRDHRAQAEVLADVAQEGDQLQLREPRVVVHQDRRVRAPVEVQERLDLLLEPIRPAGHLFGGIEGPLARLARRIADEASAPADQDDRPMSGQLGAT
jgi:hypothetical protein